MLHAMELAASLSGFNPSERLLKAADDTIEHIERQHSATGTARAWKAAA